MTYCEVRSIFRELKYDASTEDLTAHIVFTRDSFDKVYPRLSRTYRFTSGNKAFQTNRFSRSIFADCLDGVSDQGVRLDWYMADEGNANGWKAEDCYILEQMRDSAAVPRLTRTEQEDGTVCYFFGDTCIRARESYEEGKVRLEPLSGDQAACGEWTELEIDRVYGYCTLLERHLNEEGAEDEG